MAEEEGHTVPVHCFLGAGVSTFLLPFVCQPFLSNVDSGTPVLPRHLGSMENNGCMCSISVICWRGL